MADVAGRKTPIRTCVSCRQSSEKRALIRIVRGVDGRVGIDPSGKAPGRGAYLCGAKECTKQAIKGKKLGRALRCDIPVEFIRELEERMLLTDAGAERRGSGDEAMNG